ncbi:hypothetical protein Ahy_A07g034707 [Arachis hypogaea]|uniref:Aminotransferase-like plant mobile domain-containing protein n=1 Tax=Arachis hypogaea TaxID=3818 RepID=A0A445CCS3_ARAHY|nr:hypothetical protein Ahy_A07g034707 [Arachis hypogaea]
MCRMANRLDGFDVFHWLLMSRLSADVERQGPRVVHWRLRIDLLHPKDFLWMPYSLPDVVQVVHPKILEPQHMALGRATIALIYLSIIEWHQVDRVPPQLGGVQHRPRAVLDIDFLMVQHVLQFDVVLDPGPSHAYLEWWHEHGRRFLSPELLLGDPRAAAIPAKAMQRGFRHVPDMVLVLDIPDRRHVE